MSSTTLKASDLARIFGFLGEEKQAGRIARAIEGRRKSERFSTTTGPGGPGGDGQTAPGARQDPSGDARVFQALRIFVNEELTELAGALFAAERVLKPGGRLAVVTFHSLEDRIVKRFFQDRFGRTGAVDPETPAGDGDRFR